MNLRSVCLDKSASGDLEVTVEFLTEIDKLVQLLESPIFTCKYRFFFIFICTVFVNVAGHVLTLFFLDLRLHLLDSTYNHFLRQSLYSMLMLLPQSNAFRTLKHRLDCVPNVLAR